MFSRLLLGLLRDGHARHGYELITSYRARSGLRTNPGNFYRELAKLVAQGLIEQDVRPRDADPRRIPYRITEQGRGEFDVWMLEPISGEGGLEAWVLFADMLSTEDRQRVLERRQEELWLLNKSLARSREVSAARRPARRRELSPGGLRPPASPQAGDGRARVPGGAASRARARPDGIRRRAAGCRPAGEATRSCRALSGDRSSSSIDVHKSYGSGDASSVALSGVSLEIRAGSFVSLMGPSGSGKTTLLNLIAGLDAPDAGRVILDGNDLATLPGNALADFRLHNVGFVFQAFNLVPSLTVANNVAWPLEFAGVRRGEVRTRVEEALERTGVSGRDRRFPAELSGGEQQRVAIARAIATRPRLLLADEPTGNLDSHSGRLVLDLLADLNRAERVTIVMVTHNAFAAAYGDRTLEVRDGRLVRDIAAPMRAAGAHHDVGSR